MALRFAFIDGHGTMQYMDVFDTLSELEHIDWSIMRARYRSDTNIDNDRKRRRQAFNNLVHLFWGIA
ncbi:MAG: DarT ssDNA thymidine ADP-ribosyltransferase family protein [Chloroflexota bacterium]